MSVIRSNTDFVDYAIRARQVFVEHNRDMPYADYLKTDWWHYASGRAIDRAGGICELCRDQAAREAHHTTYERIGCERPDDLIALCRKCHQHITDNGLDRVPRRKLLSRRRELLHSPEFCRGWARL